MAGNNSGKLGWADIAREVVMPVVVFGSINMDLVVKVPRMPSDGETLVGTEFFTNPGGKGANQGVAAARMGVATRMVGRVGGDGFGKELLGSLEANGVAVDGVAVDGQVCSGTAMIMVDDGGQNRIVVLPAANGCVDDDDIQRLAQALDGAEVLLLQLEVPMEMVLQAAEIAKQKNVTLILDPAPAQKLPDQIYSLIDVITPNQSEAEFLIGFPVNNANDAARAAEVLKARGIGKVVVKMGGDGACWTDGDTIRHISTYDVEVVDTVAAGDTFNGCLAAALASGKPFTEAIDWVLAGSALSVAKQGAQQSMPVRDDVLMLIERMGKCGCKTDMEGFGANV